MGCFCAKPPEAPGKNQADTDIMSKKLDMCLTDGIIKSAGGTLIGAAASVLFLRRRRWPLLTGLGAGIGVAYSNCEYKLNEKS